MAAAAGAAAAASARASAELTSFKTIIQFWFEEILSLKSTAGT